MLLWWVVGGGALIHIYIYIYMYIYIYIYIYTYMASGEDKLAISPHQPTMYKGFFAGGGGPRSSRSSGCGGPGTARTVVAKGQ